MNELDRKWLSRLDLAMYKAKALEESDLLQEMQNFYYMFLKQDMGIEEFQRFEKIEDELEQ